MTKTFELRDLRGFNCLSYFLSVASTSGLEVRIVGKRDGEDQVYAALSFHYASDAIRLHQSSLITQEEPIVVQFDYPQSKVAQIQLNTDTVMTAGGKVLINYVFSVDFDGERSTAMLFDLTGWKSLNP